MLVTVLAWRLAQGPVDVNFLTGRLEAALNTEGAPTRIAIGGIALAWEGFNRGLDSPVDLRLSDIAVVDTAGRKWLEVPNAVTTLSAAGLLTGRLIPRAVALDGVRLTVSRAKDDTIAIQVGSLAEVEDAAKPDSSPFALALAALMRPAGGDRFLGGDALSQLRHIRLTDLGLRIVDQKLGMTWTVPRADGDLVRRDSGGIDASGSATLDLGDQRATATLTASSSSDRQTLRTAFAVTSVVPAALARTAPGLSGLAALDLPLSAKGTLVLSSALLPQTGTLTLTAGSGSIHLRTGAVPVQSATLTASGTPAVWNIEAARLVLPGSDGKPDTTLSVTGTVDRGPSRLSAALAIGVDRVAFADLPRLWPAGLGGGARPWITENMTDGIAHDGHLDIVLGANRDFSDMALMQATGSLDADDLTVHWFRPTPPVEKGRAHIRVVDADTIDIDILAGQQRVEGGAAIAVSSGSMRIEGMSVRDQVAEIAVDVAGPLSDVVAFLKEPRLGLLSTHPIDLREPAGEATVAVKVKLPLETWIQLDDVDIAVTAQVRQAHLTGVAAGHDLDQAALDIAANKDRLTIKGTGFIAGIAAKIDGSMDFRASKSKDVTQRIAVSGTATAQQLAAAGLDLAGTVTGDLPLSAVWSKQIDGSGDIAVAADLTAASGIIAPLAWHKPAGSAAKIVARLVLSQDRLSGIESIVADGPDLALRGTAAVAAGRVVSVRLDRLMLGRTDVRGVIQLPAHGPIGASLSGPSLDMAAKVMEKPVPRDKTKPEPPPGPAWTLTGSFGRVLLANDVVALNVTADAVNDGRLFQRLRIAGTTQPSAPFSIGIAADNGRRRMNATAADAGAFLRGLDAVRTFQGGLLNMSGSFDDSTAAHALTGTTEVTDFRVRNAPALGKLLQAMTLYGLVDVVRGAGLGFASLTVPFVVANNDLELNDARAFSPSLGMTVKGHMDMNAETLDLEGTIVPAYFFNSLLGKIPFVGRLFRGEEGGGVFAARYTIRGPTADPTVFVNPLSMLTPGFLRGVFGIF